MKRRLSLLVSSVLIACLLTACHNKNDEPALPHDNRTVLVYMLADNNLATTYNYDRDNIRAMSEALAENDINGHLVIYYAGAQDSPTLQEIKHAGKGQYTIETIKRYNNGRPTTSVSAIQEVLHDVTDLYDTRSYGLILWSHATGWLPQNRLYTRGLNYAPSSFGREGDEGFTIDIDSLQQALKGNYFDFILFDACLMGSVEVAYELRNTCRYIIASPTETLGSGFPYSSIIPLLFENEIDYVQVCKCYYDTYIAQGTLETGTIALINTASLDRLAALCKESINRYEGNLATESIQYYDRTTPHVFYDIDDYMRHISDGERYAAFAECLAETVPYKAASATFINISIEHYSGLSCYIVGSSNDMLIEDYYTKLEWYNDIYK